MPITFSTAYITNALRVADALGGLMADLGSHSDHAYDDRGRCVYAFTVGEGAGEVRVRVTATGGGRYGVEFLRAGVVVSCEVGVRSVDLREVVAGGVGLAAA